MIKYIILGIVQGLTEFLPVSSSGHLAIIEKLFNMNKELVELDIVLHLGTTCALIIFFYKDILNIFRNF
jgi:undecaprenyl-diphosphatase